MIYILFIYGLLMGSFAAATSCRISEFKGDYSKVLRGRSKCDNCNHVLGVMDLIPVLSYLLLRGRCRYCHKKFSSYSTLVELITGILFSSSFLVWPYGFTGIKLLYFIFWLLLLTTFVVLVIYDFRHFELPTTIVYEGFIICVLGFIVYLFNTGNFSVIYSRLWGIIFGGGIFYLLYMISSGKWIGGGDVRLGFLLGFLVGGPLQSIFMIFLASLLGIFYSLILLIFMRDKSYRMIPFGPFLIMSGSIIFLLPNQIHHLTLYLRLAN